MTLITEPDEAFEHPPEDALLWRYMDIPKFLHLVTDKSLWFSRADQLGDDFEGSTTQPSRQVDRYILNEFFPDMVEELSASHSYARRLSVFEFYISSWHESERESAAMWGLYTSDYGVAIVTTLRKLSESLQGSEQVHIGRVKYIDYLSETIPIVNQYSDFLHKRLSFEHEKEVRLVIQQGLSDPPATISERDALSQKGINISIEIPSLIKEIRIDPFAPPWVFEAFKKTLVQMDIDVPVNQSSMAQSPIF